MRMLYARLTPPPHDPDIPGNPHHEADLDVRSHRVTDVTVVGVRGHLVAVEAHIGRGTHQLAVRRGLAVRRRDGLPGLAVCPEPPERIQRSGIPHDKRMNA